ncbi:MAG: hypothetical protein IH849_10250 [Acidobacteria bacterium]|nr:hypothetical protein [Acidobacteriota bacterium]
MSISTLVILAGVAFGGYAIYLQRRIYLLQYLFFCRFPISVALILAVVLPASIVVWLEDVLGNLADLGFLGIMFTAWLAIHTAWVVLFSLWMLLETIPGRAKVGFVREGLQIPIEPPESTKRQHLIADFRSSPLRFALALHRLTRGELRTLSVRALFWYALLAAPLIVAVVWKSTTVGGTSVWANIGAALLGVALAWVVRLVVFRLTGGTPTIVERPLETLVKKIDALVERRADAAPAARQRDQPQRGLTYELAPQEVLDRRRARALAFVVLTSGFYIAGAFLLSPNRPAWMTGDIPVLLTVLLLLTLACLLLSWVAAALDVMRVPVFLSLFIVLFVSFQAFDKDHYYRPIPPAPALAAEPLTPEQLIERWSQDHASEPEPVMVVVASSGGGITAARWTADVLTRLQHEIGAPFGDSIALVSSVSGGGVGAMYFIDRYRDGNSPAAADLCGIKDASAASSLSATSWGFLYRDLWSILPGMPGEKDRGWALERAWSRQMDDGGATLRSWRDDARQGRRPVPVFNATVAETGRRFLLTPLSLGRREPNESSLWYAENFNDLYPGWDLPIVSAARLSATFPWISPIARPARDTVDSNIAYHLADGGYFDNHGVATAVDFLRTVKRELAPPVEGTDEDRPGRVRLKILLIQIRAAEIAALDSGEGGGFIYAIAGPGITMLQVRAATQVARNEVELELLRESWPAQIDFHTEVFDVGPAGPLSWHLTAADIAELEAVWTSDELDDALLRVKALFGDETPLKGPLACGS